MEQVVEEKHMGNVAQPSQFKPNNDEKKDFCPARLEKGKKQNERLPNHSFLKTMMGPIIRTDSVTLGSANVRL